MINEGFRSDPSGVYVYMDWIHALIHKGEFFEVNDTDNSVDITSPKYWHFKTADDEENSIHARFDINCSGGANIEFFESPTLSSNGTELTIQNLNRRSNKTSDDYTAYYDPGVNADGTRLIIHSIGSGGGNAVSGRMSSLEFILKKDTSYLVKVTVRQNSSVVDLDWYTYTYNYIDLVS